MIFGHGPKLKDFGEKGDILGMAMLYNKSHLWHSFPIKVSIRTKVVSLCHQFYCRLDECTDQTGDLEFAGPAWGNGGKVMGRKQSLAGYLSPSYEDPIF